MLLQPLCTPRAPGAAEYTSGPKLGPYATTLSPALLGVALVSSAALALLNQHTCTSEPKYHQEGFMPQTVPNQTLDTFLWMSSGSSNHKGKGTAVREHPKLTVRNRGKQLLPGSGGSEALKQHSPTRMAHTVPEPTNASYGCEDWVRAARRGWSRDTLRSP